MRTANRTRYTRGLMLLLTHLPRATGRGLVPRPGAVPHWAVAAVLLGLALRVGWYAADPCVWGDEVWLIANVLGKSFAELAGPLDHNQAAPPLFLWGVKACAEVLGDGPHALRLIPFAASCAGLVLVAAVGGGYPRAAAGVAAVLLAGSSKMLGHTAEVKPYTLDFCVAAAVAVWFCRWADRPLAARLWAAAAVGPLVVLLVYPGCFLAGGVLLGLAARVRTGRELLLLGRAGAATGAAFALLLAGPAAAQQSHDLRAYWVDLGHFPNWSRPAALPGWVWSSGTGIFRYCLYPLGLGFVPFAAAGFVALWRTGRRDVAVFLAGPLAVALAAGLLGKYPFGGSRLHLYAAPGLALLAAAGVRAAWQRLGTLSPRRARFARAALATAAAWGVVEGATFPLLFSSRPNVRPGAACVQARPPGDPVLVADDALAYYLRRDPNVLRPTPGVAPRAPRAWVAGVFDRPGTGPSAPLLALWDLPVAARYPCGPVTVFRLERPAAGQE